MALPKPQENLGKQQTVQSRRDARLPVAPSPDGKSLPPAILQAWEKNMVQGFENNEIMFKETLGAFMHPYNLTIWMYVVIFVVGIGLFVTAVILGLRGNQSVTAIVFGGLSVASFLAFFIRQPVEALEENLECISWLGVAFNTYWTKLMYISDTNSVQKELEDASADFCKQVGDLIDKHDKLRQTRAGSGLETTSTSPAGQAKK